MRERVSRRGRPPREHRPEPTPDRVEPREVGEREIPPYEYERHLADEHGLQVVAEPDWPTEIKRYRLIRATAEGGARRQLGIFTGTRPEALAHFYRYLHPSRAATRQRRRAA